MGLCTSRNVSEAALERILNENNRQWRNRSEVLQNLLNDEKKIKQELKTHIEQLKQENVKLSKQSGSPTGPEIETILKDVQGTFLGMLEHVQTDIKAMSDKIADIDKLINV